jgi:very-short-patch-repair endonuclease
MLKIPKPTKKKKPRKPLQRKSRFKSHDNTTKQYHQKRSPEEVQAFASACRTRRLAQPTEAEAAFLQILHSLGLREGKDFEREKIAFYAGGYKFSLFDFFLTKYCLAVELDSFSHRWQAQYDLERDEYWKTQGITTIRIKNVKVILFPKEVIQKIGEIIS